MPCRRVVRSGVPCVVCGLCIVYCVVCSVYRVYCVLCTVYQGYKSYKIQALVVFECVRGVVMWLEVLLSSNN